MSLKLQESISSFVDDELDAADCEALVVHLSGNEDQKNTFGRYCLVSDAIKRNLPENPNHDLLKRVQGALESEPALVPVENPITKGVAEANIVELSKRDIKQSSFKPTFGFSIAATVTLVAVLGFQMFTGSEDLPQKAVIASNLEPSTQQITIAPESIESSASVAFVADELPLPNLGSGVYAEQSVIDDGQWTRITRVGDISLRDHANLSGAESHVLFDFQRNALPFARSVNLDSVSSE